MRVTSAMLLGLPGADVVDDANAVGGVEFFVELFGPGKGVGHAADEGDGAGVGEGQVVGQVADAEDAEEFGSSRVFMGRGAVGEDDFGDVGVEQRGIDGEWGGVALAVNGGRAGDGSLAYASGWCRALACASGWCRGSLADASGLYGRRDACTTEEGDGGEEVAD